MKTTHAIRGRTGPTTPPKINDPAGYPARATQEGVALNCETSVSS